VGASRRGSSYDRASATRLRPAPYYGGFAFNFDPTFTYDFCADSTQSHVTVPCTPTRRFSIAAR
jgi:hypothetical protein